MSKTTTITIFGIVLVVMCVISYGAASYKYKESGTVTEERGTDTFLASYERDVSGIPPLLPITQSATCSFDRLNNVTYEYRSNINDVGREADPGEVASIYYTSSIETQPNVVSFIDLDTDVPKMIANMGQDDLVKIYEDDDTIHLVEKGPISGGTLVIYTIFKKEGLAIWTKQYDFIGVPLGYMGMGYCK